ncbi:MAG: ShlB/FhaC/HecB family hemolysin secretion/activation protein [Caulobacteraceae bacterium]|nr:ShlB/FhaC/HecB family hemolysin secretion/activation protein [Caulobacteraceae bacterium]
MMFSLAPGRQGVGVLLLASALGLTVAPVHAQEQAAGAAPETGQGAASRRVDINEYFVEGNTALSDPEIERTLYPFLGPDKSLDDVEKARAALQKAYEAKGLKTVFVEIPQQNVVGGRVRLAVTEARIGQVAISGGKHTSRDRVLEGLPQVKPGTVPDLDAFSADLIAFNTRSSDRQVTPQLKAGAEPGTVDVDLKVDDKLPLHGSLEFNNRYSQSTTKDRVAASLRYDDLWGRGHSLSAYYAIAPQRPKDSEVYVASYGLPISNTLRLDVTGLVSNSDVSTVGSTNVLGDGHSVTGVLTKTLPAPSGLYHRLTLSAAYKDFKEDTRFLAAGGAASVSRAPITYFPLALGYAGTLSGDSGVLGFDLTGTFAFRGLGSSPSQFDTKRYRATGGFAYLRGGVNYLWNLPKGLQLYSSVDGQVSNEPLISNEQMAIGGAGSVRGYLVSEAIGDNGVVGTLELRSPSLARLGRGLFDDLRVLTFVDGGQVSLSDPLAEQRSAYGLLSVGAGLRLRLANHVSGDLDFGWPLEKGQVTRVGDTRLHFRLSADF